MIVCSSSQPYLHFSPSIELASVTSGQYYTQIAWLLFQTWGIFRKDKSDVPFYPKVCQVVYIVALQMSQVFFWNDGGGIIGTHMAIIVPSFHQIAKEIWLRVEDYLFTWGWCLGERAAFRRLTAPSQKRTAELTTSSFFCCIFWELSFLMPFWGPSFALRDCIPETRSVGTKSFPCCSLDLNSCATACIRKINYILWDFVHSVRGNGINTRDH